MTERPEPTMRPELTIRPEQAADVDEIRALNEAAFGRPEEAALVDRLRASDAFIPALSLVATGTDRRILGHLLISWVDLVDADRSTTRRVLSVAPLAVLPEWQKLGIGAALTEAGIAAAEVLNEPMLVLIGHASYYPRFGFEPARQFGVEPPDPNWGDAHWMIRRLTAWDPSIRGTVVYPPAFDGL